MTPKENAEKLILKFMSLQEPNYNWFHSKLAKQCALIAVDEIFEFMKMDDEYTETVSNANSKWVDYWEEVKKEIEKL
jgi:hypothetical protein